MKILPRVLWITMAMATGFGAQRSALAQDRLAVAPPAPTVPTVPTVPATPGDSVASAVAPATAPTVGTPDQEFLRQAAALHATGLELAKLAEKNAGTEEMKVLAQDTLGEHSRSLAAMRELARSKNMEIEAVPSASQQATISDFAAKMGQKFDDDYQLHLLAAHEEAIRLFAGASSRVKDLDVRMFAERSMGDMKERHAAMGGQAVKLKGEVGLKIAKPVATAKATKVATPAKATAVPKSKAATVRAAPALTVEAPVSAAALSPTPNRVAPIVAASPVATGPADAIISVQPSQMTPPSARSESARRAAAAAALAARTQPAYASPERELRSAPTIESDIVVTDPRREARSNASSVRAAASLRRSITEADLANDADVPIARARVARVVPADETLRPRTRRVLVVEEEAPRRVLVAPSPERRVIRRETRTRVFQRDADDDDDRDEDDD